MYCPPYRCVSSDNFFLCSAFSAAQRSSGVRVRDSAHLQVRDNTGASMDDFTYKDQTLCSYQQISCLDSVIRCVPGICGHELFSVCMISVVLTIFFL